MTKKAKFPLCRKHGIPKHSPTPFTCRACGKQACWECVLRFWMERALPQATGGLDAQEKAIAEAKAGGKLLGCCSQTCRAKLPRMYKADFRLVPEESSRG